MIGGGGVAGVNLGFVQSATADVTSGAISVVGTNVYRGTGATAEVIGAVDAVQDGQNGADLKVNFSVGFTNGSVDSGTAGSSSIEGWTTGIAMVNMGVTEIANWVTPVDSTYPAQNTTGDVTVTPQAGTQSVSLSDYDAGYTGDLAIRLNTGSYSIAESYGIIRGPYVYSNGTVVLQAGDSVSFAWKALSGGDAFDAYGYLLNVNTGATITLLDQTGTTANQETTWATVSQAIGAGQDGEYRFVFIAGSFDLTGGNYLGGELMVDDVSVTQANPPAPVQDFNVNLLAQLATFESTADDFDDTALTITYTATPGTPAVPGSVYTASNTIAITETNDAPEFDAALALGNALPGGVIENTVSAFATAAFSDPDAQFSPFDTLGGIAISGNSTDPADGTWSYSADGGTTWTTLPAVSAGSALVLDASALLRFEPADRVTSSPSLTVHAIDSTWSAGYSTAASEVLLDTTVWSETTSFSSGGVAMQAAYEQLVSATASIGYADTVAEDDFTAQSGTVSAVTDTLNTGRTYSYALDGGTDAGDGTDVLTTAYGTMTLDRTTGAWSFEPDDAAINELGNGDVDALSFDLLVQDGAGGALTQTLTVNLTGADDPIQFEAGPGAQFLARGDGIAIAETLSLSDDGAALIGKVTVSLEQGVQDNAFGTAYETLSLSPEALEAASLAGLTVDIVNGNTGSVLTLTGIATPDTYQAILRGLVYGNTNPNAVVGTRTVEFEVEDDLGAVINADSVPVQVAWAPWFDMNGPTGEGLSHEITHVEAGPAVNIATSDAQILDQDGTISSVVLTLTNPLDNTGATPVEYLSVSAPVLALLASYGIVVGASDGVFDLDGNLSGATEITFFAAAGQTATRFQTAIRGVQYTNTADNPTTTDRVVTVNGVDSDGNTGLGGQTIIHIVGTNDAPVATSGIATGAEDTDFVFVAADFGFSDPADGGANALAAVLIDTLPASGILMLDGVDLTEPTEVSAADLAAGLLVYRPAVDQFGAAVAAFDYRLRDDSGAENDLSTTATLTIDLAPENDAPVLTAVAAGALNPIDEDVSLASNTGSTVADILAASGLTISDVDLAPGAEPQAIAVTGLDTSNGNWQVKIADGQWTAVDMTALNSGNALLLDATDALRFLPDLDWNGTVENAVTLRAWDKTTGDAGDYVDLAGNAGNTGSISVEEGAADLTVEGVDDAPFISGRASVTLNEDGSTTIDGFTIGDGDGDALTVRITLPDANAGTLELLTTAGVAGTTSGTVLEFSGSIADLQTALNSLRFTAAPDYNGSFDLQLEVSDDEGANWQPYSVSQTGQFFWAGNGHYYEFVNAQGISWQDAVTQAAQRSLYGLEGYLATVTSAEENAFIAPLLGGQGWIGASDEGTEGTWLWMTGPEAGTAFWQGLSSGAPVNGEYNNWAGGEPNNLGGEDYAHYLSNGQWNDYPVQTGSIQGYVVEYGGMPGDAPELEAAPLTINVTAVNDAPVLADNDATFQMTEDDLNNAGHLVGDLLGSAATDVDTGAHAANNGTLQGIAVFAAEATNGAFEYSLDGGMTWQSVVLTDGEVLLLRDTDLIRHQPDGQNGGTASFDYYAWDQSTGLAGDVVSAIAGGENAANRGGSSAYSADAATVGFVVADVDDAPTLAATSEAEYYARGPSVAVFAPGDVVLSDVDGGGRLTAATVALDPVTAVDNLFGAWESIGFEGGPLLTTSSGAVLTVSGSGTSLTLSGDGSLADYTEALEALRYVNTNPNMTVGSRSVLLSVTDDTGLTSAPVTVTVDAEWATVVDLNGAGSGRDHAVGYTEGMAGVAIAAADAELVDQDGNTQSITATLLDAVNGADESLFIDPATVTQLGNLYGIVITGNGTDAITLTAAGGLDPTFFQAALRTIQYANASTNPTDAARHVLVETTDMAGHPGVSATTTINVTPVNSVSIVDPITAPATEIELADASSQALALTGTLSVTDGDIGEVVEMVVSGTPTAVWSGGAMPDGVDVASLIDPAALTLGSVAADGSAQTVGWSYAATADLDWLADGETLTLTFDVAADDGNGTSAAAPLVITITGTNDAPTGVTLSASAINENTANGAARIVATLDALDPDASDLAHTFAIAAGDDGFFFELVNGNQLKFRDGVLLDAEGKSSYTVNLTTTDALGQSVTTQHVISIDDVNEFALTTPVFDVTPIVPGMRPNLIPVDTADGSFVGVRAISGDADATDEVVLYELVSDMAGSPYAAAIFRIEPTGPDAGRIYLADGSGLASGSAYDLFVRATSSDGSNQISSIRMQASPGFVTLTDQMIDATEAGAAPFVVTGLSAGANVVVTFSDGTNSAVVTVTSDGAYSADLSGLTDGPVTVSFSATSATGGQSGAIAVGGVMLDTVAPAGALAVHLDGPTGPEGAVVGTVSGLDEGASWEYSLDGGTSWTTGTGSSLILPPDAEGEVLLRQFDDIGNRGQEITRVVTGNMGDNILMGTNGDDSIDGWDGADMASGGLGNDTLNGGAGSDTLIGNMGDDTFIVDSYGDQVIEAANEGTDTIETNLGAYSIFNRVNVENLTGTSSSGHWLTGNNGANGLTGAAGHDMLIGGGGNDTLTGNQGDDTMNGGSGADRMIGGAGNDLYIVDSYGDQLIEAANEGVDTIQTSLSAYSIFNRVDVENLTGTSGGAQTLTGNAGDNLLIGGAGATTVFASGGNDTVFGGAGNDRLDGGSGDDRLDGGAGADVMLGGLGDDTFVVDSYRDVVIESTGQGVDGIETSLSGYSIFNQTHVENLTGTAIGAQTLTGNLGHNVITGGAGATTVFASGGNDTVDGGAGDDMLDAGSGDDILTGGADNDTMFGGGGADAFVFDLDHGQDTILDFAATDDWLALSSALVGGLASGAEVLAAHAMVTEAGVAFDFGAGNTILLQGVTSLDGLDQRIEVFGDMLI